MKQKPVDVNTLEEIIEVSEQCNALQSGTSTILLPEAQQALFPIEILQWQPIDFGTVQRPNLALGGDGVSYVAKGPAMDLSAQIEIESKINPCKIVAYMTPTAEILGAEIARRCQLQVPEYNLLIDIETSELYFGSKFDFSAQNQIDVSKFIDLLITGKFSNLMIEQLWVTFAIDCFLLNIDRHINNYLYVHSPVFNNTYLRPFDYGLSSFSIGEWPYNSRHLTDFPACKTIEVWKFVKTLFSSYIPDYFSNEIGYKNKAKQALFTLDNLPINELEVILNRIPNQWLTIEDKEKFKSWWDSTDRSERISKIIQDQLT